MSHEALALAGARYWRGNPVRQVMTFTFMVAVVAALASIAEQVSSAGGPKRVGLRAIPVGWQPEGWVAPETADPALVPIPCLHENFAPFVPGDGYSEGWFGVSSSPRGDHPWSTIPPCVYCQASYRYEAAYNDPAPYEEHVRTGDGGWVFYSAVPNNCAYGNPREGWLVVSAAGTYFRVTPDLRRADPLPILERLAIRFGQIPLISSLALALLTMGAWLVLRRRSGPWLMGLGLVIAWLWLVPLSTFVERL